MRRFLIKPMTLLHHLEGSERLLGLIVIVELPWQIRNQEQDDREHTNDPGSALVLEKMFCPAGIHRVRCIAWNQSHGVEKDISLTPALTPGIMDALAGKPFQRLHSSG